MSEKKKFKPTQELIEVFQEYIALIGCRDESIKSFFGTNRAVKFAKRAEKKRVEFWNMSYELYKELKVGDWSYHQLEMEYTKLP